MGALITPTIGMIRALFMNFSSLLLIAFLAPIAFFVAMHTIFVRLEEKALEETFGKEYLDYKNRVRYWL